MAARFISKRGMKPTSWTSFENYVNRNGGFLTEEIRMDVKELWNLGGNMAYSHRWAAGLVPCGRDEDGLIWRQDGTDYRETLINSLI
jgi:hypothetical protein